MSQPFAIAVHGGAGTILRSLMTDEKETEHRKALSAAVNIGFDILKNGGAAMDAAEAAVRALEDCPLFNAGRGSVFNHIGGHEMDASIMCGRTRKAGAVSLITGVRNPITLARQVMEQSGHVFLGGAGAMEFAKKMQAPMEPPEYFFEQSRYEEWQEIKDSDAYQLDHSVPGQKTTPRERRLSLEAQGYTPRDKKFDTPKIKKLGTVGAVALDVHGNLAAATSTGGMTNKKFGRVGDTPMIGAGTYADNKTCAVSCTGDGEYFIRAVAAHDVHCHMEYKGCSLDEACEEVVQNKLVDLEGDGGLIAVDNNGNICMEFNTEGMYRACRSWKDEAEQVGIYYDLF